MNSRVLLVLAAVSAIASGCVLNNNATAYNPCKASKDCSGLYSNTCVTVTQNWGTAGYGTDAICTTGCSSDNGCARSHNGRLGFCSTDYVLGANPGTCFERCYYDSDCASGFVCRGSTDVYGLPKTEAICVPVPDMTAPPLKPSYEWCNTLSECDSTSTLCQQLNPKWYSTTATFQLNICTVPCSTDVDCPLSWDGEPGFCEVYYAVASRPVCIERCNTQSDCLAGFVCAPMSSITGLPNTSSDTICVPDPNY